MYPQVSSAPQRRSEAVITPFLLLAPRTKPGAVIRPGLDASLKDTSLYMNPVSMSRSRKLHLIDLQFDHSERVVKAVPT